MTIIFTEAITAQTNGFWLFSQPIPHNSSSPKLTTNFPEAIAQPNAGLNHILPSRTNTILHNFYFEK
jgi:hypothetical protein